MKKNLVFVHGWCTDPAVWDGSIRELAVEGSASLGMNLPGHGSAAAWDEPTLGPALGELERVTAGLEDGSVIGIGWSLGAEVLMAAAAGSSKFRALVLVGATPCFAGKPDFAHGQPRALVRRMIIDMSNDPGAAMERFLGLNFTDEEMVSDEAARTFIERYRRPAEGEGADGPGPGYDGLITALRALRDTDLRGRLKDISIPVLVIHGSSDSVCPIGAGRYLASEIAGAGLTVYERAGHAPFVTNRDRFNRDVRGFIDGL